MSLKVLIVDDYEGVRETICDICREFGYEANSVSSGKEAIKILQREKYDMVLIDYDMPGLNGIQTTEKIRRFNPDIKIYLHSSDEFAENQLRRSGFDGQIEKTDIKRILKISEMHSKEIE